MGLFSRDDFDDFDDYRREQREAKKEQKTYGSSRSTSLDDFGKKPVNLRKTPKLNVDYMPNGNIVYKKEGNAILLTFILMFIIFLVAFASASIVLGNGDGTGLSGEVFVPFIIMGVFFAIIFGLVMYADRRCRSFTITNDSILVEVSPSKIATYSFDEYINMTCKRTYGKNNSYTGTNYTVLFRDSSGAVHQHKFCSNKPQSASDFNYRVRKKREELKGETPEYKEEFVPRTYEWPESLRKSSKKKGNFILVIPFAYLVFIALVVGMNVSLSGMQDLIPVFAFSIIAIVVTCHLTYKGSSSRRIIIPDMMSLSNDAIDVNGLHLRSSAIKSIQITGSGVDNPYVPGHASFYIETEEGQYRFRAGAFFPSMIRRSFFNEELPNWSYDEFYHSIKKWCEHNNVPFMEYLI